MTAGITSISTNKIKHIWRKHNETIKLKYILKIQFNRNKTKWTNMGELTKNHTIKGTTNSCLWVSPWTGKPEVCP